MRALFISAFFTLVIAGLPVAVAQYPCQSDMLEVIFRSGVPVYAQNGHLSDSTDSIPPALRILEKKEGPLIWERMFSDVSSEHLDQMQIDAELIFHKPVQNLNNIFYLRIPEGRDVWEVADSLMDIPGIVNAYPVPLPMPLPTPDHQDQQEYLNNESDWPPTGVSAYLAWTKEGGDGTGTTVCDLEYSWNYNHVDLSKAAAAQLNPLEQDPYDTHHGTAVIGELIADDNGWGVTGICHGANLLTYGTYWDPNPPHTNPIWRLPEAMINAALHLSPGDVMLLEQQWEYTSGNGNFIPVEWWGSASPAQQTNNAVYAAIQNIIGAGIHLVEPAGNGGVDLDTLVWYGDSGAVIVGAGGAYSGGYYPQGDLAPLDYSCYGNRVNVQGWGENVTTTGYGSYTGYTDINDMFCWDFAGTSSASPMVAASIACSIGYWTHYHFQAAGDISPALMRTMLINNGTPQDPFTTRYIGPRPDLKNMFIALDHMAPAYIITLDLQMPSAFFNSGDPCNLWAYIENPGPNMGQMPVAVLLEAGGAFFFYPSWTSQFTYSMTQIGHGTTSIEIIPNFNWPPGTGSASGIRFYGAVLTTDLTGIMGLYDMLEFGFSS